MADKYAGFSQESKAIIEELEDFGWTFTVARGRHAIGKAPDGVTTGSIPRTLSRANRSQQNSEAILKAWRRKVDAAGEETGFAQVADAMLVDPLDPVLGPVLARAAKKHADEALQTLKEPDRHIMSAKPWLSRMSSNRKKGTTALVENERVEERAWSDGVVDYACMFDDCDYVHANPRAVAVHFGQKHTKAGVAEKRDAAARVPVAVDVPIDPATMRRESHHVYTPTERLVKALAEFLLLHGDMGGVEETAAAALQWFHERPDLEDVEVREHRPMTDSEIVARVRLLVGGRDVELEGQFAEAQRIIQSLKAEVGDLSSLLAAEREAHARVQADLDAWLSLAPKGRPDATT